MCLHSLFLVGIGEIQIRVVTLEGDQRVGTCQLEKCMYPAKKCFLMILKGVGMKDQVSIYLEMSLTRMRKKLNIVVEVL